MDPEEVLNLFDSCWFNLEIFKTQPSFSSISSKFIKPSSDQPKLYSLRSIILRSKSDELSSMSSFNYGSNNSESPNSVLFTPQLQTILSGKVTKFEPKEEENEEEEPRKDQENESDPKKKSPLSVQDQEKPKKVRRRTKIKGVTKSLSDLEFEELKGFMDLGFVFSEKDKDSSLAEIIPGLQRFGSPKSKDTKEIDISAQKVESKSASNSNSRRPYLSEAWQNLDKRKNVNLNPMLMNWRVPSLSNEVDVKDSLRLWAHNVASVVR